MILVLFTHSFVVCDVLSQRGGLLNLPEQKVTQGLFAIRMQRGQCITFKVVQDEVPLLQEVKHAVVTVPREISEVIEAVHLAHVVLGLKVVVDHPRHLQTGNCGVFFAMRRPPCGEFAGEGQVASS